MHPNHNRAEYQSWLIYNVHTQTHKCTDKGAKTRSNTHTLTSAAHLNWAKQGLGGRTKQDRKYSSQMERWRSQRAGVMGKREEIRRGEELWERETWEGRERGESLCSSFTLKHIDLKCFRLVSPCSRFYSILL